MKDWEKDVCKIVSEEFEKGSLFCSDLNDMYDDIFSMLRGERPKKNYDWESNIVLNKVFQHVYTTISYVVKKIYAANPIVGVDGFDSKGCWQREMLLQKWMDQDKTFLITVMSWLRLLLNGTVFIKKTWKQEIDTSGSIPIPRKDHPHDVVLDNKNVVVDWMLRPGQCAAEGRFVINRETVDLHHLKTSRVNYKNLDEISEKSDPNSLKSNQDTMEERGKDGQTNIPYTGMYSDLEVYERIGLMPIKEGKKGVEYDKEGDLVSVIATVAYDGSGYTLIRFDKNIYNEINIIDGKLYLDPVRWSGMGMIEPVKDYQTAINDNINAMFDEIWRNLQPPTIINDYAMVEWDTIQHAPGQLWRIGGNPNENVMFPRPSNITSDAWMKHQLLDSEMQLTTSVTPQFQGMGQNKTATQGVLNAQFSTEKIDFLLSMYAHTVMIPSAKMNIRFAQMFGHPVSFATTLGEPFKFDNWEEEYKFTPAATTVKFDQQKEQEITQDIQIIQILQPINNPNTPKMINHFLANILRNRGEPKMAEMLDEDFYEPSTMSGNMQMLDRLSGAASNQNGVPMSQPEQSVRRGTY